MTSHVQYVKKKRILKTKILSLFAQGINDLIHFTKCACRIGSKENEPVPSVVKEYD